MLVEASKNINIQNILKAPRYIARDPNSVLSTSIFISNPLLLQGAAMGAVIASSKKYKSNSPNSHLYL